MTGRAHKEMRATQQMSGGSAPCVMSNDPTQPEAGPSNCRMCRNKSSSEANDPLATVDTDNRPRGASSPHGSAGQSSERVVASAPQLRRQIDDVDQQECKESRTCNSSDASEVHEGPQTHTSSEMTQGTPLVVPDTCCLATDDMGVTAMSCGSGIEEEPVTAAARQLRWDKTHRQLQTPKWGEVDGLLTFHGHIYVPDLRDLRRHIITQYHNLQVTGHPGHMTTLELISHNYWWPQISRHVRKYTQTCGTCLRNKVLRH